MALVHEAQGVALQVETPAGPLSIRADWLVACDGGRSTVREQLGLQLQGMQYDGKYVIVDVRQKTRRAVERLAWFDPPSNPGSTILMHCQPEDVWRIDYQIRADEDPLEAVKPENVLPRVQSHLAMIGEDAPWELLWISIYNAKCLTLTDPSVRSLINPRQSAPIRYADSPLNLACDSSLWANDDAAPGVPAPEAQLEDGSHLSQLFGFAFVCLVFADAAPSDIGRLQAHGIHTQVVPPGCIRAWQRYGLGRRRCTETSRRLAQ